MVSTVYVVGMCSVLCSQYVVRKVWSVCDEYVVGMWSVYNQYWVGVKSVCG